MTENIENRGPKSGKRCNQAGGWYFYRRLPQSILPEQVNSEAVTVAEVKEIEFDAASNPYLATSTTAECLALIFMIVVSDPRDGQVGLSYQSVN